MLKKEVENLERSIFDEWKYNWAYDGEKRYTVLDLMIIKHNIIKMFINLPDDLLESYESYK